MRPDIFLSICQTDVDGYKPSESTMFKNFFDQVQLADTLGFGTAWVAETHLSCQTQKSNSKPVIPHFKGEIGLNTDILQLAQTVLGKTKSIHIGSAIRNILCNGGPIAHAEAIQTALALMPHYCQPERRLEIGFASGRFEFSNRPYGIVPRNELESKAWPQVKTKALHQATEILLRLLNGESLSSSDIEPTVITRKDFRSDEDFLAANLPEERYLVPSFWNFETLSLVPKDVDQRPLVLTLGSHDPALQEKANRYRPVRVFNLSITPNEVVEATHKRMSEIYHSDGGPWQRDYMPRTAMVFVDNDRNKAKQLAERAWTNYWKAMEGTLDTQKVESAVGNALAGDPQEVKEKIQEKYHKDDRLMLWFDFNHHDNEAILNSMKLYWEEVAPHL